MNMEREWAASDVRIARAIEAAIEAGRKSTTRPINVSVHAGTVTLTGHVKNQSSKDILLGLVRETEGVINIVDNLMVGGGHPILDWFFPWRDPNQDLVDIDKGGW